MESPAATNPVKVPSALLNRNFVLLWQGQLVSMMGNQAFSLAMMFWLMETTGSASLMGLVMMVSTLPGVFLGPFGGAFADRHSRLKIIVVSDILRGLSVLVLPLLMYLRPGDKDGIVAALFAVALFGGIVNSVFQPAIVAAIPDLVPTEKLAAGNSLHQFSTQISMILGQLVGGPLYAVVGAPLLFLIDGVTFLLSAVSEMFVRLPTVRRQKEKDFREVLVVYRRETADGIRYVWQRLGMRTFLLVAAIVNFFVTPVFVLMPFYVTESLHRGSAWYGFLLVAFGAGALAGYVLAGSLHLSPELRRQLVTGAYLVMGVVISCTGLVQVPWLAWLLFFLIGGCTGIINILVVTLLQITTPPEMRGRVMALMISLSRVVAPMGMVLGGIVADASGKNIALIFSVCGVAILALSIFASFHGPFRSFLAWDTDAAGEPA